MLTVLLDEGREADEIALALEQDAEELRADAVLRRELAAKAAEARRRQVKTWPRRLLENLSLTCACL